MTINQKVRTPTRMISPNPQKMTLKYVKGELNKYSESRPMMQRKE